MERVESLMATRKWRNMCLRTNIVSKDKIQQWGKVKLALCESNEPKKKNLHDRKLVKAIAEIAPEWWGENTRVCLNRNVKCEKHRDGNKGHSYILFLGDFQGGALLFENGSKIEEKNTWHKINGQIPHWNEEHKGTKYSIIIYQSESNQKKTLCINQKTKAKKHAEAPGAGVVAVEQSGLGDAIGAREAPQAEVGLHGVPADKEAPPALPKLLKEEKHSKGLMETESNTIEIVLPELLETTAEAKTKRTRRTKSEPPPPPKTPKARPAPPPKC